MQRVERKPTSLFTMARRPKPHRVVVFVITVCAAWPSSAELGMAVTVVDEYDRMGASISGVVKTQTLLVHRRFARESPGVKSLSNTVIVDAPDRGLLSVWSHAMGVQRLDYDAIVLATGAYDRTVAVPGWTLPGVLTAGAASTLAKTHGVTPGQRILVAGSGPFLLAVADDLSATGCQVEVVAG